MRDPKRIRKFCNELADLWESKCPDLRFGQIMAYVSSKCGDSFYQGHLYAAESCRDRS